MAGMMHAVHLWDTWSTLTQAVCHGKSVVAGHTNKRGGERLTAFIASMHQRACQQASALVALLDLSAVSRVLDIGGGSGAYSMAFVRANETIKATVFDLPNVIALTRDYIQKEGLSNRVETVAGDYNIDKFGSGFDLVFLSAIIHINSPEGNRELIRKGAEALNPQGQMVIQDFVMDEDRTTPALGALFALNMLVATESGDTYTESEIRMWMEEAGLAEIIRKDTGFGSSLIIGRRILN
jgi:cyclopropane fatty-acyl-phospholipid synthase-like methyltransferase